MTLISELLISRIKREFVRVQLSKSLIWRSGLIFYTIAAIYSVYRIHLLGPNSYEQGFMFTAAVATSTGLVPNRDFFMQYGPTTPVIQGIWLRFFGANLVQLQYATLASILITSVILFHILQKKLGVNAAMVLTLLWFMTGPHGNPWSSIWSNFFSMLGVYALHLSLMVRPRLSRFIVLIFGQLALVLGLLSRIQIVMVIFLSIIWLTFYGRAQHRYRKDLFTSLFFTLGVTALILDFLDLLKPWIQQSIVWPATSYIGKGPGISLARFGDATFIVLVPFSLVVLLFLIIKLHQAANAKLRICLPLVVATTLLLVFMVVTYFHFQAKTAPFTLFNPQIFAITYSLKFSFFFTFGVLSVFVISLVLKVVRSFQNKNLNLFTIFDCLALGIITQLYPLHDPYHVFVVVPSLLISIVYSDKTSIMSFAQKQTKRFWEVLAPAKFSIVNSLLCFLLVQNLLLGLMVDYRFSEGVLRGINSRSYNSNVLEGQMLSGQAKRIERLVNKLSKVDPKTKIRFYCKEGLYSASNGTYMADDPFYVDWGPIPNTRPSTKYKFFCNITNQEVQRILSNGAELIFRERLFRDPMNEGVKVNYVLIKDG